MAKFPETKWKAEKESAIAYFNKNGAPQTLEALLNKLALIKPDDLYGYMSRYFYCRANEPRISKLEAREGLSGSGGRSVDVQIQATVCGQDQIVATASVPLYLDPGNSPPSAASKGGGGSKKSPRSSSRRSDGPESSAPPLMVSSQVDPMETVLKHLSMGLVGRNVKDLMKVDEACEEMAKDAMANGLHLHSSSLLAVSSAAAIAGAHLSSLPLFLYLLSIYYGDDMADIIKGSSPFHIPTPPLPPEKTSSSVNMEKENQNKEEVPTSPAFKGSVGLPSPVVAVLRVGSGKLKLREFCLVPLCGSSVLQQVDMTRTIFLELGKLISSKSGISASFTQPNSPYTLAVDKPEQAMQWLEEASTSAGYQLGKDVGVLIDVGAERLYDLEKEKYELLAGPAKTADDVISFYADLIQSFKSIIGFIDPLHSKDIQGWKRLDERLGNKCLLVPDVALENGLPLAKLVPDPNTEHAESESCATKVEEPQQETGVSVNCVALTWLNTLSGTVRRAEQLKAQSQCVMMRTPFALTSTTAAIVDLAVACQCSFVRLGAPTGLSTILLSRLVQIREELIHRNIVTHVVENPTKHLN